MFSRFCNFGNLDLDQDLSVKYPNTGTLDVLYLFFLLLAESDSEIISEYGSHPELHQCWQHIFIEQNKKVSTLVFSGGCHS